MIEPTRADHDATKAAIRDMLEEMCEGCIEEFDYGAIVNAMAAHRQQAEDAMKERCAKVAKLAGCGCEITERDDKGWPTTVEGAARHTADYIEQQIRGIDAGGEGE
jgi:hypothetical protein